MASGSGKNVGYEEKEGCRLVYDPSDPCKLIQIRLFRQYAKIGDPVNAYELIYDNNENIINQFYINGPIYVDNLDIRVPEEPVILTVSNVNITGICNGIIVKDGDSVIVNDISDINKPKLLGKGSITSNSFNIIIDLSSYLVGDKISIGVEVRNERYEFHGASKPVSTIYMKI